jgi:hypothetical protein
MLLQTHEACQCGLHKVMAAVIQSRCNLKLLMVFLNIRDFADNVELV